MSEGNPAPSVVLRKEVVERLATTGPQVRSLVVSKLVDEEIEKRKVAVLSVLGKVEDKFKELKKAEKQGTVTYNSEGAPTTDPVFTKQQVDTMNKLREDIESLENTERTSRSCVGEGIHGERLQETL